MKPDSNVAIIEVGLSDLDALNAHRSADLHREVWERARRKLAEFPVPGKGFRWSELEFAGTRRNDVFGGTIHTFHVTLLPVAGYAKKKRDAHLAAWRPYSIPPRWARALTRKRGGVVRDRQ